jgi:hypothetical protein
MALARLSNVSVRGENPMQYSLGNTPWAIPWGQYSLAAGVPSA